MVEKGRSSSNTNHRSIVTAALSYFLHIGMPAQEGGLFAKREPNEKTQRSVRMLRVLLAAESISKRNSFYLVPKETYFQVTVCSHAKSVTPGTEGLAHGSYESYLTCVPS